MLLSHKREPVVQLQVADSVRYREAVSRLKRILYNRPSTYEYSTNPFSWKETNKYFHEEPQRSKEELEKEIPDKNVEENQKSLSSLFEMIKRQDDLIAQLEKENLFLKTELVSTAEASKEIALQNESFRKRLTDTLIQMETSPDISDLNDADEKADEIINCLKEEREKLVECMKLQEETISTLRRRETEAIDKVKQAVSLAEDSQKLTDKVRESGDVSRKELQHQVEDAFEKIQLLQHQLHKAQERDRASERLLRDHEKNISRLEEDSRDKDLSLKKRELDYQNQIEELNRSHKEAEAANERLEKVLQEQRNTSEATFKRLEALLDRRNLETESFTKRRKSLEKQITDLKQENQRLLQAINDLAKERSSNTDDVKYATQVSSSLPSSTKNDLNEIKSIIEDHHNSIAYLQEEVFAVRQEMAKEIEGLRNNMGELYSSLDKTKEVPQESKLLRLESRKGRTDAPSEEIFPSFSYSDGYESMRDFSKRDSYSGSAIREIVVPTKPEEKRDRSMKILTIPYSGDRIVESQKVFDDEEDEKEKYEEFKGIISEEEEEFLSDTVDKSELETDTDQISQTHPQDDRMMQNNIDLDMHDYKLLNKRDDKEISRKEIKNFEEEKDKDESLVENDEKDRDGSLIICDTKYDVETLVKDEYDKAEDYEGINKENLEDNEEKYENESLKDSEGKVIERNLEDVKDDNEDENFKDNYPIDKNKRLEDNKNDKDQSFKAKDGDEYLEECEKEIQKSSTLTEKEKENLSDDSEGKDRADNGNNERESHDEFKGKNISEMDVEEKKGSSEILNASANDDSTLNSETDEQLQKVKETEEPENEKTFLENNEQSVEQIEITGTIPENEKESEITLKSENQAKVKGDIEEAKDATISEQDKDVTEGHDEIDRDKFPETATTENENMEKSNALIDDGEVAEIDTLSSEKEDKDQTKTDGDEESDAGGTA